MRNRIQLDALRKSIKLGVVAMFAMMVAFIASFYAEGFEQETGIGTSILGYNRDWLVDGRWYFLAACFLCLFLTISSVNKTRRLSDK